MPNANDFRDAIQDRFTNATGLGMAEITIRAGDVHQAVGGYPAANHAMPTCCNVMRQFMTEGDEVLEAPPRGRGANLVIRYILPRH